MREDQDSIINRIPVLLAVTIALFLVTYELPNQILVGDEWHALNSELVFGYFPIRIYFRILSESMGLSDWFIRIPFVLGFFSTVIALPVLLKRVLQLQERQHLIFLFALSPLLLLYGRIARPYIWTTFLTSAAILLFLDWWRKGSRQSAILYICAVTATGFLHVGALPFVLVPFLVCSLSLLNRKTENRLKGFIRLVVLGFSALFLLAVAILAQLALSPDSLVRLAGKSNLSFQTAAHTLRIFSGTNTFFPVCVLLLLSAIGITRLYARDRLFTLMFAASSVTLLALIALYAPIDPLGRINSARYFIPLLPLYLVCVAVGLSEIWNAMCKVLILKRGRMLLGVSASILFYIFLFLAGPIPSCIYRPNNWFSSVLRFQLEQHDETILSDQKTVSEFYTDLGNTPAGSFTIVELPWFYIEWANPFPWYQQIHGQRTLVAITSEHSGNSMNLGELSALYTRNISRNIIFLSDVSTMENSGVNYIVLHKNLRSEVPVIEEKAWLKRAIDGISHDIESYREFLREQFGNPYFEDDSIVVFEM